MGLKIVRFFKKHFQNPNPNLPQLKSIIIIITTIENINNKQYQQYQNTSRYLAGTRRHKSFSAMPSRSACATKVVSDVNVGG
jgi:hypothetical protein